MRAGATGKGKANSNPYSNSGNKARLWDDVEPAHTTAYSDRNRDANARLVSQRPVSGIQDPVSSPAIGDGENALTLSRGICDDSRGRERESASASEEDGCGGGEVRLGPEREISVW
ncbi:hypothetical protein J3458_021181 [Metarhizium acridum]|uniref:uncharacterized protein n=1 Tax=Metarhizium acridum TaxID=92637 RepID=UPI001C6C90A3|nr:hypothetical protein J3458_021181 [Metarhizium acridum]